MIRILYVNGRLINRGGIESCMMNHYRHLDRCKIQYAWINLNCSPLQIKKYNND